MKLAPSPAILAAMDDTDAEILRVLREDGRISWSDLGAAVGLSANAAAERVRRLRRAGVITGFVALVDPAAGGRTVEALVGVTLTTGTDSDTFAAAAARLEPVQRGPAPHRRARLPAPQSRAATPPSSTCSCATLAGTVSGPPTAETTIIAPVGVPRSSRG